MHKKLSNLLKVNMTIIFVLIVDLDFTKIKILGISQELILNKCLFYCFLIIAYLYLIIRAMHEYHAKKGKTEFISESICANVKEKLYINLVSVIKKRNKSENRKIAPYSIQENKIISNLKIRDFMRKINRTVEYSVSLPGTLWNKERSQVSWWTMFLLIVKSRWESLKSSMVVFDYYLTTLTTTISIIWVVLKIASGA